NRALDRQFNVEILTSRRKRSPFDNYRLKISTRIYEPELLRDFEEIVDSTVSSPDEYKKLLEFYTEYRLGAPGRPGDFRGAPQT
ncbi:MAG: hypothetical protein RXQ79_06820, partial [Acidilobus sp.]